MRKHRYLKTNAKYHITCRANRQEMIFSTHGPEIKELFLGVVAEAKEKYTFDYDDFNIMDNHVHLVIKPLGKSRLPKIMQWILSVFAKRYNKMFGLKGHVWYDRYKSKIIETITQFINTIIYIANNPVRANIVDHPLKWEYCGLYARMKKSKWKQILDPLPGFMDDILAKYLKTFERHRNLHQKTWEEYTFQDKKPGRPRKTK